MAFLSQATALAVAVQSDAGVWASPSSADLYPCTSSRPQIEGITAENPEYLGTIHKPGPLVLGSRVSLTLGIVMRPPGGASPPAAGAFIPGRFLRAGGFSENVVAAAIPAAAEAIGGSPAATTSSLALGSTAAATAQLYKGLGLLLSDNGTGFNRQLTAIRDYTSGKVATLFEVLGSAPAADYQIPKQLAYTLSPSTDSTWLSISVWFDKVRYDLVDLIISSMRFNFPATTREATEYPTIEITVEGDLYGFADDDAPTIPALGGIPTFKDGDFWLAGKALGGSGFNVDLGIQAGYAPNPNRASGNEAAQMVSTQRSAQITLNHQLKATIDFIALAQAQSLHGLWAQYGYTSGAMVGFSIPQGRFNYPNPDNSGEFVTQTIDMLIDDADRAVSLYFPYT